MSFQAPAKDSAKLTLNILINVLSSFFLGGRNKYKGRSVPWREETNSKSSTGKAKAAIECHEKGAYVKGVL